MTQPPRVVAHGSPAAPSRSRGRRPGPATGRRWPPGPPRSPARSNPHRQASEVECIRGRMALFTASSAIDDELRDERPLAVRSRQEQDAREGRQRHEQPGRASTSRTRSTRTSSRRPRRATGRGREDRAIGISVSRNSYHTCEQSWDIRMRARASSASNVCAIDPKDPDCRMAKLRRSRIARARQAIARNAASPAAPPDFRRVGREEGDHPAGEDHRQPDRRDLQGEARRPRKGTGARRIEPFAGTPRRPAPRGRFRPRRRPPGPGSSGPPGSPASDDVSRSGSPRADGIAIVPIPPGFHCHLRQM